MDLPFKNPFAVSLPLCVVGIQYAYGKWIENEGSFPLILWVHPTQLALADSLLDRLPIRMIALPDSEYESEWWSVGTRSNKGYGCDSL